MPSSKLCYQIRHEDHLASLRTNLPRAWGHRSCPADVANNPIPTVGRLLFCTIIRAITSLVAHASNLWALDRGLAGKGSHSPKSKTRCDPVDRRCAHPVIADRMADAYSDYPGGRVKLGFAVYLDAP